MKNVSTTIIVRTVFRRVLKSHAFHANVIQSERWALAQASAELVIVKPALLDENAPNAHQDIVEAIAKNVHAIRVAQCLAVNVNHIVNAR